MKKNVIFLFLVCIGIFSCGPKEKKSIPANTDTIIQKNDTSNTRVQMPERRPLEELLNVNDPAWPMVLGWKDTATNKIEILPRNKDRADEALYNLQVTTHSTMGAIVYETGGILIDGGWLRILGSGHPKFDRDLPSWNLKKSYMHSFEEQPPFLLVADDVIGGFYAINNGGISEEGIRNIFYFAPDRMEWEDMEMGYTDFIFFCFFADLGSYYDGLRWKTWKQDLKKVDGAHAFYLFPIPSTVEGSDVNKVTRSVVPVQEMWDFYFAKNPS